MARCLVSSMAVVLLLLAVAVVLSNVAMASSPLPTSGGEQDLDGGGDDDKEQQQQQQKEKEKEKQQQLQQQQQVLQQQLQHLQQQLQKQQLQQQEKQQLQQQQKQLLQQQKQLQQQQLQLQQQQKENERQLAKQKAVEEEKAAQKEQLKYAEALHLVSPTKGAGSYKGIAREFVDAHNKIRVRYDVPPVKWDNNLARQARRWSNAMRKDCQLKHSGQAGQSVFISHDDWNATATDAVKEWCKEEAIYDKQRQKCLDGKTFKECGHFSLIVAKRSARVGCARAECFQGGVFVTCNYAAGDGKDKDKDKEDKADKSK